MTDDPLLRDISDTARWVAVYRARETDRPDAVFKDPYARVLAGERGERIASGLPFFSDNAWSMIARTFLFDRFVTRLVKAGVELIVNLAAGLDARPYRMELPSSLRWVEIDLPEILDYKARVLADATPRCGLERIALDLSNPDARRGVFDRLGRSASHAAVLTEGLLIYLMAHEVGTLGWDLARQPSFRHWVVDLASPGLMTMLKERAGEHMMDAGAPFLFAPPEGPPFFSPYGWNPVEVKSILKTAGKLGRLPFALRMISLLPESTGAQGNRPWSGVVLLQRR
ncbi:MAG TPA: SAM-dependent methyltransferase [Vicinamibacterales bacterium]|nr:SAM-dependent methyltransferase [Vicinamibacterales bacterium]